MERFHQAECQECFEGSFTSFFGGGGEVNRLEERGLKLADVK